MKTTFIPVPFCDIWLYFPEEYVQKNIPKYYKQWIQHDEAKTKRPSGGTE